MNYSELNQMSIEELRNLNSMVITTIKNKKAMMGHEMKHQLYVGANVSVITLNWLVSNVELRKSTELSV